MQVLTYTVTFGPLTNSSNTWTGTNIFSGPTTFAGPLAFPNSVAFNSITATNIYLSGIVQSISNTTFGLFGYSPTSSGAGGATAIVGGNANTSGFGGAVLLTGGQDAPSGLAHPNNIYANTTFGQYGGLQTYNNGVPVEYTAGVDLVAQSASIGTTTLYAVPSVTPMNGVTGAGQYRVSWNTKVTTAATTSSSLNVTIVYTDPDGNTITLAAAGLSSAGAIALTPTNSVTSTGVLIGVPLTLNCKAGTNITYSTTYASSGATAMQYNLHIKLEEL
jgi:hypothetical protein